MDPRSKAQLIARAASDYAQIATEELDSVGKFAADAVISLLQNAPSIALSIAGMPRQVQCIPRL